VPAESLPLWPRRNASAGARVESPTAQEESVTRPWNHLHNTTGRCVHLSYSGIWMSGFDRQLAFVVFASVKVTAATNLGIAHTIRPADVFAFHTRLRKVQVIGFQVGSQLGSAKATALTHPWNHPHNLTGRCVYLSYHR
jgi:hypothetical protein